MGEVEPATGIPERTLVPVCGHPARVFQHARRMQQVPGHEGRIPVGEVALRTAERAWNRATSSGRPVSRNATAAIRITITEIIKTANSVIAAIMAALRAN